jgi:hypothetical protein
VEARLLPLNALLGLVTAGDINPSPLADAGFRLVGLEIPAIGAAGKVVIDALLFHEATNHLVQCESKSGPNIKEEQAGAYNAMTANAVVQAAYVTLRHRTVPTLETLYLCLEDNAPRIRQGLNAVGLAFPVLAVGPKRVVLDGPEMASQVLREALQDPVTLVAPPPRIIAFDAESPVEEIEKHVRATLVSLLANRTKHVSLTGLTERAAGHYALYGHMAQNQLKKTVAAAIRAIVVEAPDSFAFDGPTGSRQEGLIRFLKTPEDLDRRGRTQAYQALGRAGKTQKGRKVAVDPNQLDLLGELDVADNNDEEFGAAADEEGDQS